MIVPLPVRSLLLAALSLPPATGYASSAAELTQQVRAYRQAHEPEIVAELVGLLALRNVASDDDDIRRNAAHLQEMLAARGVESRLLEVDGGAPSVLGERSVPGARRTVVFYSHYDGQPVDPALWSSPPWQPLLRDGPVEEGGRELDLSRVAPPYGGEWRLYARSASDDKAPIVAALVALDALAAAGVAPSVNLKFFFEGEEEAGSPHLKTLLQQHRDLLAADLWLFCDGPVHQSRRPQVVFGVRGVMGVDVTVYGPLRALHSGHYGNWAPNPAAHLAHLVAGMRGVEGEITIAGIYDSVRPLSDADRAALAAVPDVDVSLRRSLGLAHSEADDARLVERILQPALNVRGLAAAQVGRGAKNAIPTAATATLGFRLVPDQRPEEVRRLVEAHLRGRGYHLVAVDPDLETRLRHARIVRLDWEEGYRAMRTPLDVAASRAVLQIVDDAVGEAVRMPILGGSLPLYLFEEVLGTPLIVTPMVNHDNNQHAPNENLRLQNLWDGIEIYAALMARLGEVWEE